MPRRQSSENFFDERIFELQKMISTLEWDIPRIKNNELKAHKEGKLSELKNELDKLAKEKSVNVTMGVNHMPKRSKKKEVTQQATE